MPFKQNLLKKIEIDGLAGEVIGSIRPSGTEHHIAKDAMRQLLDFAGYVHEHRRDVDLYYQRSDSESPRAILVLDNELAVYETTIADVVMRKSPYVKEMVSIRNVIKILSDKDVIRTKKADTVRAVHAQCLEGLDLSFTENDLEDLKMDGLVALEGADAADAETTLSLFAEILDYRPPPASLSVSGYFILGGRMSDAQGDEIYGPHVIYDKRRNRLMLAAAPIRMNEKDKIETFHRIVQGTIQPDQEGPAVFSFLRENAKGTTSVRKNDVI